MKVIYRLKKVFCMRALLKLLVHASARVKKSVPRDNFFRDPEPNHVAHPHKSNNFN